MKRFKVVNKTIPVLDKFGVRKFDTISVTLHKPPYTKSNILNKTGWKVKDCTITDMNLKFEEEE
jgi:hypothetical protein|tara:strand:- start:457 stop:648 length:192 start_codon:yes stop_codon:yes gene_type:complete